MTGPEQERFWAKVNKDGPGGCWLWTGSRNIRRGGYGQFKLRGRTRRAHIVAFEELIGPVPDGMQLDHRCNVTDCVRPASDHVRPEAAPDNNARSNSRSAVAARATVCPNGHPYDGENLYRRPDGRRECRTCSTQRQRERRSA